MPNQVFDPNKSEMLMDQAKAWQVKKEQAAANTSGRSPEPKLSGAWQEMINAFEQMPETVTIPYHLTAEGERWTKFKKVCDERFHPKIDYALVANRASFDRLAIDWDGSSPGPCAVGGTGQGKTRAAWWALRRLYVAQNKPFAWFPARRLCSEMDHYESKHISDEFFRTYDFFKLLFVDDVEKINWDFKSNTENLFAFFDWIYRTKKPCLVTTNRDRAWWCDKMGEAFARRMFDEACVEVKF